MTDRCANCHFWRHGESAVATDPVERRAAGIGLGTCVRYPPAVTKAGWPKWPRSQGSRWCGEWTSRLDEPLFDERDVEQRTGAVILSIAPKGQPS